MSDLKIINDMIKKQKEDDAKIPPCPFPGDYDCCERGEND